MIDRDVRSIYMVGAMTAQKLRSLGIYTVKDIQNSREEVIRRFGKQGQMIVNLAFGIDDRKVIPYRPEDAKSISREITFQEDVDDPEFLKDVLILLSLCVENRVRRYELHGQGVALKITYADMKSITRSQIISQTDSAAVIYEEAVRLLDKVERRPVRLIGVGLYNLFGEENRQLSLEDVVGSLKLKETDKMHDLLDALKEKYHLDFEGHLQEIYRSETLYS